jgi:phospholipase A1
VRIVEPLARLACYDERERNEAAKAAKAAEDSEATPPVAPAQAERASGARAASALERRWELRPDLQRGTFNLLPYRPVYGLVHWASSANEQPSSPTRSFSERIDLNRAEAKIQLSFKAKVVEDLLATDGDIWVGYTQVSYWQAGNSRYSSPFRETNYEPEAMFVYPLRASIGGLRFRMASVGISHQSNGRSEPLSRSWNRIVGELAAEWGAWSFHVRPWARVFESSGEGNDNPDIEDFMGRAELAIVRRARGQVLTLTARHSMRSGARSHGSARLDWAFPIAGGLNAHLQAFTGYGQSLIDYNHRQTTLGVGISFFD